MLVDIERDRHQTRRLIHSVKSPLHERVVRLANRERPRRREAHCRVIVDRGAVVGRPRRGTGDRNIRDRRRLHGQRPLVDLVDRDRRRVLVDIERDRHHTKCLIHRVKSPLHERVVRLANRERPGRRQRYDRILLRRRRVRRRPRRCARNPGARDGRGLDAQTVSVRHAGVGYGRLHFAAQAPVVNCAVAEQLRSRAVCRSMDDVGELDRAGRGRNPGEVDGPR